MVFKRLAIFAALAAVLLARAPALRADEKPTRLALQPRDIEKSLGTHWYGVYFKDRKIGFISSALARVGKGEKARLVETSETSMKMTSLGQRAEMRSWQRLEYEDRPPYRLLRAESVNSDGKTKQVIRLEARPGGGFDVTVLTGGQKQTRRLAALDYTLADSLTTDVWLRRPRKPGDRITVRELDV